MSTSVSQRSARPANPTRQQLEELDALLNRMLELPVRKEDEEGDTVSPRVAARDAKAPPAAPSRSSRAPANSEGRPIQDKPVPLPAAPERRSVAPNNDSNSTYGDVSPAVPEFHVPNSDDWIQLAATWQPSAQTWGPLADTWKQTTRPVTARQTPAQEFSLAPAQVHETRSPAASTTPVRDEENALFSGLARERHASGVADAPSITVPTLPQSRHPIPTLASLSTPAVAQQATTVSTVSAVSTPWILWPLVAFNSGFDLCLALFGPLGQFLKGRTGRKLLGACGVCCLAVGLALPVADNCGWLADMQVLLKDWFGWTR